MKDDAELNDESFLVFDNNLMYMSAVMFLGISAKIKHLFKLDSEDFV